MVLKSIRLRRHTHVRIYEWALGLLYVHNLLTESETTRVRARLKKLRPKGWALFYINFWPYGKGKKK